jgi:peptidoglycan/LPS O-acetylase OafA/YrhL
MSVYDYFRRRRIALQISIAVSFTLFCAGASISRHHPSPFCTALLFIGWVALIVCAVLLYHGGQCPRCQAKIRDVPISCPNCGLTLTAMDHSKPNI